MEDIITFTEEQKELMIKHNIFLPRSFFEKEEPKFNSFSYKGKKGPCVYCGNPGSTKLANNLETSIMCEKCYYRECMIDD